jgi:hypothetical protein
VRSDRSTSLHERRKGHAGAPVGPPRRQAPEPLRAAGRRSGGASSVGLSRQKLSYLRNLAERVDSSALDLDRLAVLPDDEVREKLMSVKDIGPWSADMFLLRELGRPTCSPWGTLGYVNPCRRPTVHRRLLPPPRWTYWARSGGRTVRSPRPTSSPHSPMRPSPRVLSRHLIHQPFECGDSDLAITF